MQLDEIMTWKSFTPKNSEPVDLSFLDAHLVNYVHSAPGKDDLTYSFWVTYSFHCFAKEYPEQSEEEKTTLMYDAGKDKRPFCYRRYELAKAHLRRIVENFGDPKVVVTHAGYGSYATAPIIDENDNPIWYFVPFAIYKEKKKFRIHVTSAYPMTERPGGGKVGFFKLAFNLKSGKPLPVENQNRL